MGIFYPFIKMDNVELIGVEAGKGIETGEHAAPLNDGTLECFMVQKVI